MNISLKKICETKHISYSQSEDALGKSPTCFHPLPENIWQVQEDILEGTLMGFVVMGDYTSSLTEHIYKILIFVIFINKT